MTDKLNLVTIHQLEGFLDVWRLTLQYFSPHVHLLEIATALEIVAQRIRREEADKMMDK
jgi:hypothetical protein